MEKTVLRREMLQARLALSDGERVRLSAGACAAILDSAAFTAARLVLLYAPFRGEVALPEIVAGARAAGKRLALPKVVKQPHSLTLHLWDGDPASLAVGAYGIREPHPTSPQVPPEKVDLALVPGLAFDRSGRRLGYGGGYYDRLLPEIRAANPAALFLGICYPFQLISGFATEPHDVTLDGVATADGLSYAHSPGL